MNNYYVKSRIYTDKSGLREVLKQAGRAFIVTDRFMYESGKVSYLTEPLEEMGIAYQVFSEVKPDPDIATVTKGISIMLDFHPQILLALGGGSAIDAAKAMNYLAARQGLAEKCLFVAIPTTSGTGSEVSKFSVISDPEKSAKYPLVDDDMLPDAAILDAELVRSVPPAVTADTGIDVLTHAIEAFVSTEANDFTDAAAEKAIKLVRSNLLRVYHEPDNLEARQKMHHASCLAGMAFSNAGLGLNHSMAHTLGAHFHIPHGRANGILLPYVMAFNAGCLDKLTAAARRYAVIARLVKIDGPSIRQSAFSVVRSTKQMIRRLGIPESIKAAGIEKEDFERVLDDMAEAAYKDSCTRTNPRTCSKEEIRELFMRVYTGKLN
ncbi:1-propanol dehydrogenase PduQ [Ruminococcus gauvreauii]|uniref:Iron-containing alcohol dehydrogenase n=1 Tax=Ruminococcus gauvreauii TaxID=438033 RepID=A0ABY5VNC4_9FIRM|nr:1-propanol dehydrogenase PduQ [Ruminococcus gauvreauii]UWP60888.1 iron-containing alcohol dehydrogenase [Ruminococcus gauvreauii]